MPRRLPTAGLSGILAVHITSVRYIDDRRLYCLYPEEARRSCHHDTNRPRRRLELKQSRLDASCGDRSARQRLLDLSLGLWGHLADVADADKDGSITVEEYKKAFADGLLVTEESFVQGYRPFLDAIMAIADTDGDGKLNIGEHVRWTGALMHLPEPVARDIHRRLDSDGDGYITTEDLLQAIHDFYFDEDPAGPGSWMLGPL